jgi:hypothetical protein
MGAVIHELRTDDGGVRLTTAESFECSLKSFRKILGTDVVKDSVQCRRNPEMEEGMHNGVKEKMGHSLEKSAILRQESICAVAVLYGIGAYTRASLKMFLTLSLIRRRRGL